MYFTCVVRQLMGLYRHGICFVTIQQVGYGSCTVLPYVERAPEYLQPLKDLEDALQSSIHTAGVCVVGCKLVLSSLAGKHLL